MGRSIGGLRIRRLSDSGAYLTQNTSWKLWSDRSPTCARWGADAEGLRAISVEELRRLIRPSGFHTRKAPALKPLWPWWTKSLAAH